MANDLVVTLVRSQIGCPRDQRATVRTLGLRRIRQTVVLPNTPSVQGLLHKVRHLVRVSETGDAPTAVRKPKSTIRTGKVDHRETA